MSKVDDHWKPENVVHVLNAWAQHFVQFGKVHHLLALDIRFHHLSLADLLFGLFVHFSQFDQGSVDCYKSLPDQKHIMVVPERKDSTGSALHHISEQYQCLADLSKCANYNSWQNDYIVVNCYYRKHYDREIAVKYMIHFQIKRWFHVIVNFKDLLQ